jgi:hypothetical protein
VVTVILGDSSRTVKLNLLICLLVSLYVSENRSVGATFLRYGINLRFSRAIRY